MCQSKEQGGRRCAGHTSTYSQSVMDDALLSKQGDVVTMPSAPYEALHLIAYAAQGRKIPESIVQGTIEQGFDIGSLSPQQNWRTWKAVSLSEKPSEALRMLHTLGYEASYPDLHAIRGVPQSPSWHPEGSVEKHTQEAADVAAKNSSQDGISQIKTQIAVLGALCHDFGKATHTQIDEETGKITSYGHDIAGVDKARSFLAQIGVPQRVQEVVPGIVGAHMRHAATPTTATVSRLQKQLAKSGATLDDWIRVADGDIGGRGSASEPSLRGAWMEAARKAQENRQKPRKNFVNGDKLTQMGYKAGVEFRTIIPQANKAYAQGKFHDEEGLKTWLIHHFPQSN